MTNRNKHARSHEKANMDSALNLMFLAAFPMLLWAFQGTFAGVATSLLVIWLFSLALRFIGRGQKEQHAFEASSNAVRPTIPRKLIGSILIGVVVVILAGHHFSDLMVPLAVGILAVALSLKAFGTDALAAKRTPSAHVQRELETAAFLDEVESRLDTTIGRADALQDDELSQRVFDLCERISAVLRSTVSSPEETRTHLLAAIQRLEADIKEAEAQWHNENQHLMRNRTMAKLTLLEEDVTKLSQTTPRIAGAGIDRQAQRLMDNLPTKSIA